MTGSKTLSPDGYIKRLKGDRKKKDDLLKKIKENIRELYNNTKDETSEEFLHIFTEDLRGGDSEYFFDENKDKDEFFEDFLDVFSDALEEAKEDVSVEDVEEFLTDLESGLYRDIEDLLDIPIPVFN